LNNFADSITIGAAACHGRIFRDGNKTVNSKILCELLKILNQKSEPLIIDWLVLQVFFHSVPQLRNLLSW
jgi:hypothetical protein